MANIDEGAREPTDCSSDLWEIRVKNTARLAFLALSSLSVFAFLMVLIVANDAKEATQFSMELASFEGLNASTSETVLSPAFSLKLKVKNNASVLQPWCSNGGEVVVSYSDVALAWGHVPQFCVQRGAPTELTLMPWGRGIGLSEDVRQRLASELHIGTVQVKVGMKLFYDAKGASAESYRGTSFKSFQLIIGGTERKIN